MYMVTGSVEGVGGYLSLEPNSYFFLNTPPFGEIDWAWYWTGTTKPRSGYYEVDLYDAVRLLVAYCSRGDGVPSANWFPGADIDPYDLCHVGLYDAVQMLSKYGQKQGAPIKDTIRIYPDERWKYENTKDEIDRKKDPPQKVDGKNGWLVWESKPDCTNHTMQVWLIDPDNETNCNEFFAARFCGKNWIAECPYDLSRIVTLLKYEDKDGSGNFTAGVDCFTSFVWLVKDTGDMDGDKFTDVSVYTYDIKNNKLTYEVFEYTPMGNLDNSEVTGPSDPPTTVDGIPFSNGKHP